MANYKGHIAGAVAVTTVYVVGLSFLPGELLEKTGGILSDWQMVAGLFVVSMLMGLWPDIDTNSKGQDIFFATAFLFDIALISQGYLEAAAYFGLLAMTPIVGKHRGWTHSKLAMLLVPLPFVAVPYLNKSSILATYLIFYGAAVAGYFSHLLLDGKITKYVRVKG
ncbi:metal-dependent hydrolase [Candidatus Saccharibacteria bacterium]|nr:metal-dependent hydrolase [Candidatus Saccharibacteria bacterium]